MSLSLGFVDLIIDVVSTASPFVAPAYFSHVLAATTASVLVAYLIASLVMFAAARVVGFDPRRSALAVPILLVVFFSVAQVSEFHLSPHGVPPVAKLTLVFAISVVASLPACFGLSTPDRYPRFASGAARLGYVIPVVLGEAALSLWLCRYLSVEFGPVPFFAALALFAVILVLTLAWALHAQHTDAVAKWVVALLALVLLGPLVSIPVQQISQRSTVSAGRSEHRVRHIVLITIDTLRADSLSCYGEQAATSPNIDALADRGVLFANAFSPAPWTLPSITSVLTGLSPAVHLATRSQSRCPDVVKTLAEVLRDADYLTAAIGWNVRLREQSNLSQGFLSYEFFPKHSGTSFGAYILRSLMPDRYRSDHSTREVTRLAVRFLESYHERDFFLWLHYFDPHLPYSPPKEFLRDTAPCGSVGARFDGLRKVRGGYFVPSAAERDRIKALYTAEVRFVDSRVAQVVETLKRTGIYEDSLIIVTSDHGEEFWEHGGFEHGHTLYNELLRVPLIIQPPRSDVGTRIAEVVSIESIVPTVLDLCEIPYEQHSFSASSLGPLFLDNSRAYQPQPVVSTGLLTYEDRVSALFDGLKYVRFLVSHREELYDLTLDPSEQNSIVQLSAERLAEARAIIAAHRRQAAALRVQMGIESEAVQFDQDTRRRLRSLGYID